MRPDGCGKLTAGNPPHDLACEIRQAGRYPELLLQGNVTDASGQLWLPGDRHDGSRNEEMLDSSWAAEEACLTEWKR